MKLHQVLNSLSYSNISTYIDCPRKWKLKYVDKIFQSKQSLDLSYGTSIHQALQQYLEKQYYVLTLNQLKQNKIQLTGKYINYFITRFARNVQSSKNKDEKFNPTEKQLQMYLQYGLKLLRQLIPNISKYFPKQNTKLFGIQTKLLYPIQQNGIPFKGFLDVVLYNTKTNKYKIIDIKTSMMGWKDRDKKNQVKRLQLNLYKYLFSLQHNVPLQNIQTQFLILKKRIYQKSQFKISRIQKYVPPHSTRTVKKQIKWVKQILIHMNEVVQNNQKGQINPLANCNWCPFKGNKQLCNRKQILKIKK